MCRDNGSDSLQLAWKVPAVLLEFCLRTQNTAWNTAPQKLLEFAASQPFPGLEAKQILLVWCIAGEREPSFISPDKALQSRVLGVPGPHSKRVLLII